MKKFTKVANVIFTISGTLLWIAVGIGIGMDLSEYHAMLAILILGGIGSGIALIFIVCVLFLESRNLIKINKKLQKK